MGISESNCTTKSEPQYSPVYIQEGNFGLRMETTEKGTQATRHQYDVFYALHIEIQDRNKMPNVEYDVPNLQLRHANAKRNRFEI